MFVSPQKTNKSAGLVEEAKISREQRAKEKRRLEAVIMIQSFFRRCLCVKHLRLECHREFEEIFDPYNSPKCENPVLLAEEAFAILKNFFFLFNLKDDRDRFRNICYYLIASIGSEKPQFNYMSILQRADSVGIWRRQVMFILKICTKYLQILDPKDPADARDVVTFSQVIIMLTHSSQWKAVKVPNDKVRDIMNSMTSRWLKDLVVSGFYPSVIELLMKGLARSTPSFASTTFFPVLTLLTRPMVLNAFETDTSKQKCTVHLFAVPGFIAHVESICPAFMDTLRRQGMLKEWTHLLTTGQAWQILKDELKSPDAVLATVANLIHAFWLETSTNHTLNDTIDVLHVVSTIIFLLDRCKEISTQRQSFSSKYHPILGWSACQIDPRYNDSMKYMKQQLQLSWKKDFVKSVFGQSMDRKPDVIPSKRSDTSEESKATVLLQKLGLLSLSLSKSHSKLRLGDEKVSKLAIVSALYQTLINCLGKFKLEIITGLCLEGALPSALWNIINEIGVLQFITSLKPTPNTYTTEFQLLGLFCNLSAHLITIMDDAELYEEQKVFSVKDLSAMAKFMNDLVFTIIWDNIMSVEQIKNDALFIAAHRLLHLLYQRDSRRKFVPEDYWIMKEAKGSNFFDELKDDSATVQLLLAYAPHCVPHRDRVKLFRKKIKEEKLANGESRAPYLIPIQRKRIVEDGFEHFSSLTPSQLRGVIRIRFINEQGVPEAGIDQDGVFKEFLEEIIKLVFDPNLHLFRSTADNRLYPSPTSFIQENHLQYFNFVGKILGKAVYEGIVVDVPFANFFLSQVLGQTSSSAYSYFDELPSFDADLNRSLSNVKRYAGNIEELGLTFSCDEDRLGQIVTHELIPGGNMVDVTDENKILYVHLMAYFRMYSQIKPQVSSFIHGFFSIIKPESVAIFSPPELQLLISGDQCGIDLKDLRKNAHYYGGFHSGHRVINWLWDILEHDFNEEERGLFLKFVTSCSKPPLLGFAYMDPPFSIRCVEVSEDHDSGDTIGSVIRGFFTLGHKKATTNRLPTSSTCFNLLKLPNYQKRSLLREKLRYAIRSNSGFELS